MDVRWARPAHRRTLLVGDGVVLVITAAGRGLHDYGEWTDRRDTFALRTRDAGRWLVDVCHGAVVGDVASSCGAGIDFGGDVVGCAEPTYKEMVSLVVCLDWGSPGRALGLEQKKICASAMPVRVLGEDVGEVSTTGSRTYTSIKMEKPSINENIIESAIMCNMEEREESDSVRRLKWLFTAAYIDSNCAASLSSIMPTASGQDFPHSCRSLVSFLEGGS